MRVASSPYMLELNAESPTTVFASDACLYGINTGPGCREDERTTIQWSRTEYACGAAVVLMHFQDTRGSDAKSKNDSTAVWMMNAPDTSPSTAPAQVLSRASGLQVLHSTARTDRTTPMQNENAIAALL